MTPSKYESGYATSLLTKDMKCLNMNLKAMHGLSPTQLCSFISTRLLSLKLSLPAPQLSSVLFYRASEVLYINDFPFLEGSFPLKLILIPPLAGWLLQISEPGQLLHCQTHRNMFLYIGLAKKSGIFYPYDGSSRV